jgi:hypothetical protein
MADLPSLELVNALVSYDPETGIFTRKIDYMRYPAGSRAGTVTKRGYRTITFKEKKVPEHRLAFFIMTGQWPEEVDHKDRDKANNRWNNLREVTRTENVHNTADRPGVTGYPGVRITKQGKFQARICSGQTSINLGTYETPEEAYEVYLKEKALYLEGVSYRISAPNPEWKELDEFLGDCK